MTHVLLVCSGGGHLKQLNIFAERLGIAPERQHWVTFRNGLSESLLSGRRVDFVPFVAPRDLLGLARLAKRARSLLGEHQFSAAISTGSSPALAFLPQAARRGIPAHYIESAARADGPSLTGRIIARRFGAVRTYTQYPGWADERWLYRGSIYDGFEPGTEHASSPAISRAVVTVGTQEGYDFDRLFETVVPLLAGVDEVLWQTGEQDVSRFGIDGRRSVPHTELSNAVRDADVVIAHAGTGSALTALEQGKCPILVPRRAAHGEHVDDHQLQIAREMERRGLAVTREASAIMAEDLFLAARRTSRAAVPPPMELASPGLEPAELLVYGRAEQDWSAWSRTPDLVPDDLPYGLDRLAPELGLHAVSVVPLDRPEPVGLVRTMLRSRPRRTAVATRVSVAWDEQTALRLGRSRADELRAVGVIWATDRPSTPSGWIRDRITREMVRQADLAFCLVPEQVEAVRAWIGHNGPRVAWLRFGIDETFFTPAPYPQRPLLVSAGGDRHRDHETLAAVFAKVLHDRPESEIIVQANTHVPMPSGVRVVSRMSHRELHALYLRASAVIVATKPNLHGSGMTVALEAQACARPVVTTRTPGMQHYVEDMVTGRLVGPGAVEEAAEAVLEILSDPVGAERMGQRGRDKVESSHTSRRMIADLASLLRDSTRLPAPPHEPTVQ